MCIQLIELTDTVCAVCAVSYRRTMAITTTTAMPMSSRTPTTATTAPTTAPILGISLVDGITSRVSFTVRVENY